MWRYLDQPGKVQGPVSESRLLELLTAGEVSAATLVWKAGLIHWQPLAQTELGAWCPREAVVAARSESRTPAPVAPVVPRLEDILGLARALAPLAWSAAIMQLAAAALQLVIYGGWALQAGSLPQWLEQEQRREQALRQGELGGDQLLLHAVLLFQLFFFAVLGVQFVRWQWRAARNLRQLGAKHLRFEPWLALLWFVPVVNWVFSFLILDEVARASAAPEDWRGRPMLRQLRLTWLVWLASRLLALAAMGLAARLSPAALPGWIVSLDLGVVWLLHALLLASWLSCAGAILLMLTVVQRTSEQQLRQVTQQVKRARAVDFGEPV